MGSLVKLELESRAGMGCRSNRNARLASGGWGTVGLQVV